MLKKTPTKKKLEDLIYFVSKSDFCLSNQIRRHFFTVIQMERI